MTDQVTTSSSATTSPSSFFVSLSKQELTLIAAGLAVSGTISCLAFYAAGIAKVSVHAFCMSTAFGFFFPTAYMLLVRRHPLGRQLHVKLNAIGGCLASVGYLLSCHYPDGSDSSIAFMHRVTGNVIMLMVLFQAVTALAALRNDMPQALRTLFTSAHAPVGKTVLVISLSSIWFTVIWWKSISSLIWIVLVSLEIAILGIGLWSGKE